MSSRTSFPAMSMWFVGSSSTRKLGRFINILHRASLTFSPPESMETSLNTSSPVNRKPPRAFLTSVSVRVGYSSQKSSITVLSEVYWAICWSKYPISTFVPKRMLPESAGIDPTMVLIRVDFPSPLAPIIPSLSPLLTSKETVDSTLS